MGDGFRLGEEIKIEGGSLEEEFVRFFWVDYTAEVLMPWVFLSQVSRKSCTVQVCVSVFMSV